MSFFTKGPIATTDCYTGYLIESSDDRIVEDESSASPRRKASHELPTRPNAAAHTILRERVAG